MIKSSTRTLTTLEGRLERITYFNAENHFTIAKVKTLQTQNLVTIVGFMTSIHPGEMLEIKGSWENHPRYGQQLRIESYTVVLPASIDGIQAYLKSGIVRGIGPLMAQRMVDCFGAETFHIIENDPAKLMEVEGIGKAKADAIHRAWTSHHLVRGLMPFLQTLGVKPSLCIKIITEYGQDTEAVIRRDPYRLINDITGINFYDADAIARKLGVPKSEPERARAAIMHVIQQHINEGHMFAHIDPLTEHCIRLFQIEEAVIQNEINTLADSGELVVQKITNGTESKGIYLKSFHQAEVGLANRLKALLSVPVTPAGIDSQQILTGVQQKLALKLSDEQLQVLEELLAHRAVIITGGPGTGKTTLIRSISAILEAHGKQVVLAAPTGRAAKRLSEVTRRDARTIHRLLGYNLQEESFEKNQDNPLDADVVIIDEASMVDTLLMSHLIKAVPMTALLVMVGDVFQLPPVGPGTVLADMIQSGRIPVFHLKKIFRQAQESPIVLNAHKVRNGERPVLQPMDDTDGLSEFYFIEHRNPERVVSTIVELCRTAIPQHFSLDPVNDIQILTPMHKGVVGTINLNQVLQKALNPNPKLIEGMGNSFKVGDKVMHLKNNYQKEVFNGDIGIIRTIDKKNKQLTVMYDDRDVAYEPTELIEITLAYAISVHKSQGSEYPAVIVPIMTQHYALLQRNLLYTAITRGKKLVVLIGTRKALDIALQNDRPRRRNSYLANRLRQI